MTSRAFTLIELLAVIAIIAVLAAIIFSTIGSVRKAGLRAQCSSNMRNAGVAMLAYVNDHRGRLPGPHPYGQQTPLVRSNSAGTGFADVSITTLLAPYLDIRPPLPGGTTKVVEILLCPAWDQATGWSSSTNKGSYVLWGVNRTYCGATNATQPEQRIPQLLIEVPSPGKTAFMTEMDANNVSGYSNQPAPVHGSIRNILYFDAHVGTQSSK
ncbi:MAG TPA: prepilin-type N-terminal cleavage/methylation domain-containing protein [Rariglobus sp.]